jgi:hypothetical protein
MSRRACFVEATVGCFNCTVRKPLQPEHLSEDDTCGQGLIKSEAVALQGFDRTSIAIQQAFDTASSARMVSQAVKRHADQTIPNEAIFRRLSKIIILLCDP